MAFMRVCPSYVVVKCKLRSAASRDLNLVGGAARPTYDLSKQRWIAAPLG